MERPAPLLACLVLTCGASLAETPAPPGPHLGVQEAELTGVIYGRVEIRRHVPATSRRPSIGELGQPAPHDAPDRRRAVVYLETAPRGAFEGLKEVRATMDQRREAFAPHVLAITTGTVVDFRNSDQTYHNVFSLSRARRFDLGRYAAGRSKSVKFDRPGVVRVFCDIHSHMNAFILVFSHQFFAVTDAQGRYRIDRVPPGTYRVVVWNEVARAEPRTIQIPPTGGLVESNFVLS